VRGKQSSELKEFSEQHYPLAKNDLATVFTSRCLELIDENSALALVSPQNWWFLGAYSKFRRDLLESNTILAAASLGEEAWEAFGDRGPLATLLLLSTKSPFGDDKFYGIDAHPIKSLEEKKRTLLSGPLIELGQRAQLGNPEHRLILAEQLTNVARLNQFAEVTQGLSPGDTAMMRMCFWETQWTPTEPWQLLQSTPDGENLFSGLSYLLRGEAVLPMYPLSGFRMCGERVWGRAGVAIGKMRDIPVAMYMGRAFDANCPVLTVKKPEYLAPVVAYTTSSEYKSALRLLDKKLDVAVAAMDKVPFDLVKWQEISESRIEVGTQEPVSADPSQWVFPGHPQPATDPLQVAVARLAGYRWPAETDTAMELADEARTWVAHCDKLAEYTDDDGVVCLPPVRGEAPAHDRLLKLLIAAWETVQPGSWKPAVLDKLLADADCAGKGLDVWLRERFFEQHAKRFHHRPFIWHVWDGLKDGFAALVNYHQFDHKKLERLIHTYLGDWIRQQEAGVRSGADGAQQRLAAAQDLKRRLELILEGEPPYDIFVRWKPLAEQPIGWNPDLNDGVRLNIRPFMTAEVLRHNKKPKLNITWDKDRGKDVESAPWFKTFGGDRINDHHLTVAEKQRARGAA